MSENLNWNLNDLYAGIEDPQINTDWQKSDEIIKDLASYRGKIKSLSSTELLTLLQTWENFSITVDRIGVFAGLLESTHIGDPEVTRFVKQTEEKSVELSKQLIFIDVELAQLSPEQWGQHLKSPDLEPYRKTLEKLAQQAKHTLSEPEEKILTEKSQTSWQALSHLFSLTTDTLTLDWDGKPVTLAEVINYFHSPDAAQRKQAAAVLHKGLDTNIKTTPTLLNALVQDKSISDRLRHFDYPEESRYNNEDVDKETVEAMLVAIDQAHDLVQRYYELKKKIMKTDKLYWWDRYAPLPDLKSSIEIEKGKQLVIDSFTAFTPKLGDMAKEMMDQQHIDWLPTATKRGGAFCAFGAKNELPYVLLNYTNSPRDVMTLAHELGHATHDILAKDENVFFEIHPSLALAEIASTFGELLVFEKLVGSDAITTQDKMALLMSNIEDRFATVFRQATMFEFERALHRRRREEGELSKEQLDQMWDEYMKKPFEPALVYTPEHKNTWMYVGHIFQMPFYVFTYAFAQLCSLALFQQYREQGSGFVDKYFEVLKAGGSLSPKDNLARVGLNLDDPEFWQAGLKLIESFIDELEELTNSVK